jgi:hypothetical protein
MRHQVKLFILFIIYFYVLLNDISDWSDKIGMISE